MKLEFPIGDSVSQLTKEQARRDASASSVEADGMLQSLCVYPTFRLLLMGTLATNSAFWMYQVAVGWLALQLTDSPLFIGLAGFAGGIPMLILSLPAGVIIDRYDRRTILLAAQGSVMVVSAIFAFLVGFDAIHPWSMLVLVAIYGSVMSFIFPTRTAIVASLVERQDLANAVALNAASQNATRVLGPSIAGALIAVVGVAETFAVAAVLQSLALIATWQLPKIPSRVVAQSGRGLQSLTLGFRIVASSPFLSALIILALAPTVLVMPYINLMPIFARDIMGLGSGGLGILLASTGLGTVGGALHVARSSRVRSWPPAQVVTACAFAIGVFAFAATQLVPLAVALLFIAGWMSASFLALNQTAMQMSVEDDVRGRVFSVYLLTWGMLPIGQLAVGALADLIGTPMALIASCILATMCVLLISWRFPSLRRQSTSIVASTI
ncbi:MAG: MFS transporter [Thermomicrobiales bacterium]